jgi:hypothetical protein
MDLLRVADVSEFVTYDEGDPVRRIPITSWMQEEYGPSAVVHLWGPAPDGASIGQVNCITVNNAEVTVDDCGKCMVDVIGPDSLIDVPEGTSFGIEFALERPITAEDLL